MSRLAEIVFALAVTLWVGALWAIGLISAPVLFSQAGDVALAAHLAGKQFEIVSWLGMVCATYLLLYLLFRQGAKAFSSSVFWLISGMLVLSLLAHFGVHPLIERIRVELAKDVLEQVLRNRFYTWHGVANVLWMIQSGLGLILVAKVIRK